MDLLDLDQAACFFNGDGRIERRVADGGLDWHTPDATGFVEVPDGQLKPTLESRTVVG